MPSQDQELGDQDDGSSVHQRWSGGRQAGHGGWSSIWGLSVSLIANACTLPSSAKIILNVIKENKKIFGYIMGSWVKGYLSLRLRKHFFPLAHTGYTRYFWAQLSDF